MPTRTKILIGVGIVVVVVGCVLLILGIVIVRKSFPQTTGTIDLAGLTADVSVYRDHYGVPHIIASYERDLYTAAGFVHAQDRLWQMELVRRAGMGRLAEIFGPDLLPVDRMFRTLGLMRIARENKERLDDQTREALQAYADGVSRAIEQQQGAYPIEFDFLNLEPEPWAVEHSLLVSRMMAWELNFGRWIDVLQGYLVETLGAKRARELFPLWREGAPVIVAETRTETPLGQSGLAFLSAEGLYRRLLGIDGFQTGSNAWAIDGHRSSTGKPILANDTHLFLTAPARFYQLHCSMPGLNVSGYTIPGVPFVIIGRNDAIAWGLTNAMLDDADYYAERVDSLIHPTRYEVDGQWVPLRRQIDTIRVRGGRPVVLTSYATHRGPIVNRIDPAAGALSEQLISMRWTGSEFSNDGRAFYLINRAVNWREFREGVRFFNAPAQNFVYADVNGNIGYQFGGWLPERGSNPTVGLLPGWTTRYDWKGFVPFNELPSQFNPERGFIATANNKTTTNSYPHYISNYWEPDWRIDRITELLSSRDRLSPDEVSAMQMDVLSVHARDLVPIILEAFRDREIDNKNVRDALTYLSNWDFRMKSDDVATSVFQAFFVSALHNVFEDELGPRIMALYDTLATMPLRSLTEVLKSPGAAWFDDVTTDIKESRDDIVRKSLTDAVQFLYSELGGELKEWRWGRLHKVEFVHPFGSQSLLRPIFNVGPFETDGSHSTINCGYYRLDRPFENHVGPSMRLVVDLADSESFRSVLPPGQSGHVFHQHYDDQMTLWLNGATHRVLHSVARVEAAGYDRLILRPEN